MAEFVSDCPRCKASNISMDCTASNWAGESSGWKNYVELFLVCRRCHKGSIQVVSQTSAEIRSDAIKRDNALANYQGALNDLVAFERNVTLRDNVSLSPPEHLPENIKTVLEEANSCLAGQCYNASAAMYRLALDLATKELLPSGDNPNSRTRRNLGFRIPWLIENRYLPAEIKGLAECLQQDGNDGAHDGSLSKDDAFDLCDFAFELLRRLYTEPARLRIAEERRRQRRSGQ